jgi:hypothetical protein
MVCCPRTPKNIISEKRPAFEIGKNSGTAMNDKFNKVRYLNNFPFFIHKHQVPQDRFKDVTYAKFVCKLKPNKAEIHRSRLTVGGDKVHYPGDVGTPHQNAHQ